MLAPGFDKEAAAASRCSADRAAKAVQAASACATVLLIPSANTTSCRPQNIFHVELESDLVIRPLVDGVAKARLRYHALQSC